MSEYTREAGMITRYVVQCQALSCHNSSVDADNRKLAAAYARNMPTTGGPAIASDAIIIDTARLWAGESE